MLSIEGAVQSGFERLGQLLASPRRLAAVTRTAGPPGDQWQDAHGTYLYKIGFAAIASSRQDHGLDPATTGQRATVTLWTDDTAASYRRAPGRHGQGPAARQARAPRGRPPRPGRSPQRRLLATQLRHIDFLEAEIAGLSVEIEERMRPCAAGLALAYSIPGVGQRTADAILAEFSLDMARFPTSAHLASWARMCPGTDESAGKGKSGATGTGNVWLRAALVEAAHAAARTKRTCLAAQYRRIAARRGAKRAAVAVGHSILVALHQMLSNRPCVAK